MHDIKQCGTFQHCPRSQLCLRSILIRIQPTMQPQSNKNCSWNTAMVTPLYLMCLYVTALFSTHTECLFFIVSDFSAAVVAVAIIKLNAHMNVQYYIGPKLVHDAWIGRQCAFSFFSSFPRPQLRKSWALNLSQQRRPGLIYQGNRGSSSSLKQLIKWWEFHDLQCRDITLGKNIPLLSVQKTTPMNNLIASACTR